MSFLREDLNDNNIVKCGRCENCNPKDALDKHSSHENGIKASNFLRHHAMPIEPRKQFPKDAFPNYRFTTRLPKELRAKEGRVLSKWGDAGWGKLVAEGKRNNHFSDELVNAIAEMIIQWNPVSHPTWVTCVSSLNHTTLVPDFAKKFGISEFTPKATPASLSKPKMHKSFYQYFAFF